MVRSKGADHRWISQQKGPGRGRSQNVEAWRPITFEMTQWLIFQALPRSATTVSLEFVATAAMSIVASTFVNDRYAGAR